MTVTAITPDSAGGMTGAVSGCSDAARGYIQILMAATLFGLSGSVAKIVLDGGVEPARLTALRCTGAAFGLLVVLATTNPALLRVARRDLPILIVMSLCGATLIQWLYFVAIDRLSVSLALLLEFTAPVLVALWARFALGEAVRARVWAALVLALAGLAMVAQVWSGFGTLDVLGVAAGLAAAVSLAAYWLIGERAVTKGAVRDPISLTFWGFVFASIVLLAVMPDRFGGFRRLDQDTSLLGALDTWRAPVWVLVVVVVTLGTVTPFVLEVTALRHMSATRVGLVAMLEPVLATIVAWLWLEQVLSTWQAIGVGVVVLGLCLAQTARTSVGPGLPPSPNNGDQGTPAHSPAPGAMHPHDMRAEIP